MAASIRRWWSGYAALLATLTSCAPVASPPAELPTGQSLNAARQRGVSSSATVPTAPAVTASVPPPNQPTSGPGTNEGVETQESIAASALPAGTTVLQIGDSFAGALGIDLNRDLREQGVRGVLKYETSTYIPTWASKKDLDEYLTHFQPDLVLITLGANELLIPDPAARVPTIHRLIRRLGGRACVWVAPPLWEGARPALLQTIRESCAPCVYLDSSALVPDLQRMRDHIHPSMQGRKIWAKAVLDWLREHRDPHGSRPWDMKP